MLISRRKEGESLLIGDNIEVRIVSVRGKKVILGVVAPRDVKIAAIRLTEAELSNTLAAAQSSNVNLLLNGRSGAGESAVLLFGGSHKTDKTADKEKE